MSYTRGTFAAFVDSVVPETPGMADRGEEHVPGGLAADLDELLVEEVNDLQPASGPLAALGYDTTPLAPVVALLLDVAALELVVRRRAEEGFGSPDDAYAGGPFSRLSARDRLRAVRMLESEGVFPALADRLDAPGLGTIQYLAGALVALTESLYYGELTGDGEGSQGWTQADYPGPADGYAVMLGYELDEFEEDDY
ncbi:hypothetical protein [Halorarius halobius]|uniref:hypothetical protein n=1 Tax=Halorarius halobius TaxID=2962671 RepID=UPI0020CE177C|nr:hypothetical protein [Halorarius halobius]